MSAPRRGFLLGKFMPPHRGHEYLCDVAARTCDALTILVCSLESEPVPGELRHAWMRQLYPEARVLHCREDVPQEPSEHPDFWPIWTDLIKRYHPESIDNVFASEPYGLEIARRVGAVFTPVDIDRIVCPVSGTAVRENPAGNWAMISEPARPWFQRLVTLFGPESTGKSTLAKRLADHFKTRHVPEFGRTYTEIFGTDCTADDVVRIADGQTAAIEAARRHAGPLLFSDTDWVLSAVWSDMLTGQRGSAFDQDRPASDLYLLTDVDMPWEDDGTRYFPDQSVRDEFMARCEAELRARGLPYVRLSGDWETRFRTAVAAICERFPASIAND